MGRRLIPLVIFFMLFAANAAAQQQDLEEQVQKIASELRCPVCQNLSTGDSPSELAQEMRQIILSQLQEGKTPEEIKAYFVSKYGQWVLLAPTPQGFNLVLWILPFVAACAGVVLVLFTIRRRAKNKRKHDPAKTSELPFEAALEPTRTSLSEEQLKLSAELEELDFDFHSGRLSEADYRELRKEIEARAVEVRKKAGSLAPSPSSQALISALPIPPARKTRGMRPATGRKNWQLVSGGLFLLLFGITLGVFLSNSLRPRESTQDTLTGDFLTGTGPGGIGESSTSEIDSLLGEGRAAFQRQDWPRAIELFKKVLAIDPNQPEAHSSLGFILVQAGHADGALLAFERALSSDPRFPPALWGKGMLLYRVKSDHDGARRTLETLVTVMPAGPQRNEVQKTLTELAQATSDEKKTTPKANQDVAAIRGTISIDAKLKNRVDEQVVLFIIARSASSSGGPPLAVKRIERPKFPLSYSLGSENVMIPGTAFSGKVTVVARLDKDGNPTTRESGNITGEYRDNPVEVGAEKVDIVLNKPM